MISFQQKFFLSDVLRDAFLLSDTFGGNCLYDIDSSPNFRLLVGGTDSEIV